MWCMVNSRTKTTILLCSMEILAFVMRDQDIDIIIMIGILKRMFQRGAG